MSNGNERQRWWQRPSDGLLFMVVDPDHIQRLLAEGWHEVASPLALLSSLPEVIADAAEAPLSLEEIQERNDAARAAFGIEPTQPQSAAKQIKKIQRGGA